MSIAAAKGMSSLVLFSDNNKVYGINSDYVIEITQPGCNIFVPRIPRYLSGLMRFRNTIIPIIDLVQVTGSDMDTSVVREELIVLQVGSSVAGLVVESVVGMLEVQNDEIGSMPYTSQDERGKIYGGVFETEDDVAIVIDGPGLFEFISIDRQMRDLDKEVEEVKREQRYSVFELGNLMFCTPIIDIKRIVQANELSDREGTVWTLDQYGAMPIINCYDVFGIDETKYFSEGCEEANSRNIVISTIGNRDIGFYVGPITKIVSLSNDTVKPLPRVLRTKENAFIESSTLLDKQLLGVVSFAKVAELTKID